MSKKNLVERYLPGKLSKIRFLIYLVLILAIGFVIENISSFFPTTANNNISRVNRKLPVKQKKNLANNVPKKAMDSMGQVSAYVGDKVLYSVFSNDLYRVWQDIPSKLNIDKKISFQTSNSRVLLNLYSGLVVELAADTLITLDLKESNINIDLVKGSFFVNSASKTSFNYRTSKKTEWVLFNVDQAYKVSVDSKLDASTHTFLSKGLFKLSKNLIECVGPNNESIEGLKEVKTKVKLYANVYPAHNAILEVASDESFTKLVLKSKLNKDILLSKGKYFWRIYRNGEYSNTCSFSIVNTREIIAESPKHFELINADRINFTWKHIPEVVSYNLKIFKQRQGGLKVFDQSVASSTHTVTNIRSSLGEGLFYWQVNVNDKVSNFYSFYILSQNDFNINIANHSTMKLNKESLYKFKWDIKKARRHTLTFSASEDLIEDTITVNTEQPIVYFEFFKEAKVYYKLAAYLGSGKTFLSNINDFTVAESGNIKFFGIDEKDNVNYLYAHSKKTRTKYIRVCNLFWSNVADADYYIVNYNSKSFMARNNNVSIPVNVGSSTFSIQAYSRTKEEVGRSQEYKIEIIPDASPMILFPKNNAAIKADSRRRVSLRWKASRNKKTEYEYQISKDVDFINIIFKGTSKRSLIRPRIPSFGVFYFRVRSKVKEELTNWSPIRSFTVISSNPGRPALLYPPNRGMYKRSLINFKWSKAKGAKAFILEISKSKYFKKLYRRLSTNSTQLSVKLDRGKIYYWRVFSYDDSYGPKVLSKASKSRIVLIK